MNPRNTIGGVLVVVGLAALAMAAYFVWSSGRPTEVTPTPLPSAVATPLPTFTPYVPPTLTPPQPASLRVTCNAYATLTLVDRRTGENVAEGSCSGQRAMEWPDLEPGPYVLRASCPDLEVETKQEMNLEAGIAETGLFFPGVLEISAVPADATVEIDGKTYPAPTRVTYPAEQCPYTATVWVQAPGYQDDGRLVPVEAGRKTVRVVSLTPLSTADIPSATSRPTHPPATAAPTSVPWTVDERVALVRQKLYEGVNCIRADAGLSPLPYVSEWQGLADEYAQAWGDYFRQHGPNGFEDSAWRQQFQATGGDAVTDNAGLALYAPDYYVYLAPQSRWETFRMCDPKCPAYNYFEVRKADLGRASGVVIGLAPWWDGDVLNAAVVLGVRW
jgi:hypothetical protein